MKLNVKTIINQRIQQLNTRIEALSTLLDNEAHFNTIEFQCDSWIHETDKQIHEELFNKVFNKIQTVSGPAIYIFELMDNAIKPELIKRINAFRSINNKDEHGNDLRRATAKVQRDIETNSSAFLYVGSVKSNFQSRMKQHIGLGHKLTYALHLKFWVQPDWRFRLHYLPIDNQSLTTDLEAAIAHELKPLLGKREV